MHVPVYFKCANNATILKCTKQESGKYIYEPVREKFRINYALIFAAKQLQLIFISSPFKFLPSAGHGSI